jgi:hypothetical protein
LVSGFSLELAEGVGVETAPGTGDVAEVSGPGEVPAGLDGGVVEVEVPAAVLGPQEAVALAISRTSLPWDVRPNAPVDAVEVPSP